MGEDKNTNTQQAGTNTQLQLIFSENSKAQKRHNFFTIQSQI